MKHYSNGIAKAIKRHLHKTEVTAITFNRKEGTFDFILPCRSLISYFHYSIQVQRKGYIVTLRCPVSPAPGNAAALAGVAEYLSRVNEALNYGANGNHLEGYFDVNCNSGMIEYLYSIQCSAFPSADLMRYSIAWPSIDFDRVIPGIIGILYKDISPEAAMAEYTQRVDQALEIRLPPITKGDAEDEPFSES